MRGPSFLGVNSKTLTSNLFLCQPFLPMCPKYVPSPLKALYLPQSVGKIPSHTLNRCFDPNRILARSLCEKPRCPWYHSHYVTESPHFSLENRNTYNLNKYIGGPHRPRAHTVLFSDKVIWFPLPVYEAGMTHPHLQKKSLWFREVPWYGRTSIQAHIKLAWKIVLLTTWLQCLSSWT